MKHFARVKNDVVMEVFEGDEPPELHPSLEVVAIGGDVGERWIRRDGVFVNPEEEEALDRYFKNVSKVRDQALRVFNYRDHDFQIGREAQNLMTAALALLQSGVKNPHGGAWRDVNNEPVKMTDGQLEDFIKAAFGHIFAMRTKAWEIKDRAAKMKKSDLAKMKVTEAEFQ